MFPPSYCRHHGQRREYKTKMLASLFLLTIDRVPTDFDYYSFWFQTEIYLWSSVWPLAVKHKYSCGVGQLAGTERRPSTGNAAAFVGDRRLIYPHRPGERKREVGKGTDNETKRIGELLHGSFRISYPTWKYRDVSRERMHR